jgi:hypothetical protein
MVHFLNDKINILKIRSLTFDFQRVIGLFGLVCRGLSLKKKERLVASLLLLYWSGYSTKLSISNTNTVLYLQVTGCKAVP